MNVFFVNLAGLALIALIAWWFWLSAPSGKPQSDSEPGGDKKSPHH